MASVPPLPQFVVLSLGGPAEYDVHCVASPPVVFCTIPAQTLLSLMSANTDKETDAGPVASAGTQWWRSSDDGNGVGVEGTGADLSSGRLLQALPGNVTVIPLPLPSTAAVPSPTGGASPSPPIASSITSPTPSTAPVASAAPLTSASPLASGSVGMSVVSASPAVTTAGTGANASSSSVATPLTSPSVSPIPSSLVSSSSPANTTALPSPSLLPSPANATSTNSTDVGSVTASATASVTATPSASLAGYAAAAGGDAGSGVVSGAGHSGLTASEGAGITIAALAAVVLVASVFLIVRKLRQGKQAHKKMEEAGTDAAKRVPVQVEVPLDSLAAEEASASPSRQMSQGHPGLKRHKLDNGTLLGKAAGGDDHTPLLPPSSVAGSVALADINAVTDDAGPTASSSSGDMRGSVPSHRSDRRLASAMKQPSRSHSQSGSGGGRGRHSADKHSGEGRGRSSSRKHRHSHSRHSVAASGRESEEATVHGRSHSHGSRSRRRDTDAHHASHSLSTPDLLVLLTQLSTDDIIHMNQIVMEEAERRRVRAQRTHTHIYKRALCSLFRILYPVSPHTYRTHMPPSLLFAGEAAPPLLSPQQVLLSPACPPPPRHFCGACTLPPAAGSAGVHTHSHARAADAC